MKFPILYDNKYGDFPGGPMVSLYASTAGDTGLIPVQVTKVL